MRWRDKGFNDAIRFRNKPTRQNYGYVKLYRDFLTAEQDPSETDLLDVSSFTFKDGRIRVSDAPGCGIGFPGSRKLKPDWTVSQ